jgi:choline dehydrogenase-like flavoprotein
MTTLIKAAFASGGVSAEILALSGLAVLIVEEGALKSSRHFRMREAEAVGGCTMSADERLGVTGPDCRYHRLSNLSVHDGSLFPTSIGANPQLSIYGITARLASELAQALAGKPAARVAA